MTLGVLYLIIMCAVALEEKRDIRYRLDSYLKVEYLDGEYLGKSAVTDWGEELTEEEGYVYYRLDFEVENLSSEEYYNPPASAIRFSGSYSVERTYEGERLDYEGLFSEGAVPNLPGKTKSKARIYIQTRERVEELVAQYRPNYDEEEIEIAIPLENLKTDSEKNREFTPEFSPESVPRAHL